MKTWWTKLSMAWVTLLVVTATSAQADDKNATNLIVHVSGLTPPRGQAIASLFYDDNLRIACPRANNELSAGPVRSPLKRVWMESEFPCGLAAFHLSLTTSAEVGPGLWMR